MLDPSGEPAPVGVPGELYIGGEQVARGYLDRPALTAEKFVPDPFGGEAGARLYRTGDRVRWLADGTVEFLGRIDTQVKLRGFRIEPGEIEAVLREHPRVREAVVAVREDVPGEKRLAAYVVPAPQGRGRPELWPSVGEYPIYDDLLYQAMVGDERRNAAYREALRGQVAGKTAVDVGTGGEVLLARMCVEAGARRVYAVEVMENSFRLACQRVRELGLEDRITVIHGDAATLELPEPVDVCVSELIGSIGGSEGTAVVLDHARRWLKPGGAMLPRRCETWVAAATLPEEIHADPAFGELAAGYAELVMEAVGHRADFRLCVKGFPGEALLSGAGVFEELDFTRPVGTPEPKRVELRIERRGRLDGFLLWIRLYVGERLAVDSLEHEGNWLPVFFPAFYPGLQVGEGDSLSLECSAPLSEDGLHPDYHLRGVLRRLDGREEVVAFDSFHRRPPAVPGALHRRLVSADGVRVRPAPEAAPLAAELRALLRERLPEHMVPAALVELEELPLNVSGKVDRRALPVPRWSVEGAYAAPRTASEEVLAGIWAEVLGVERVGVEEGFFDLGGHSLLATQVVSRARQAFGVEVPLRTLFEAPTVAALAVRVEGLRRAGTAAAPPVVRTRGARAEPLPLSFAQQRLWLVDRLEPGSAAYNMADALRLRGRLDAGALRASLDALVRRHESLRTTFSEEGGRPVQVVRPPVRVPLPGVDLRGLPAEARQPEAMRLAGAEAVLPFDLEHGPLLRSTLLRLGEEEHVLLFTLHHVVSDGWSMQVLVREVSALYGAFSRGESAGLPELPVQYADFAVWQREWLSGEVLDEQVGYWKEALAGAPPLLEIATDRPRSAAQSTRAGMHRFALPSATAAGLRALSRREGTTLFMTLLAAWQTLLGRYAGQEDVVVGSPISGRNRHEVEGLIGFFVNMLALRADLAGDPTWSELLGRTRAAALGAYEHQELPFERLVEELGAERSLTHAPVFQAIFALQKSGAEGQLSLGSLELEPFESGAGVARFDLELTVTDGPETLEAVLAYRGALFEAETAARMAGHLETVLETLVSTPERRLSELSLLRGAERARVLEEWNATSGAAALPRACVHELFAEQAARTPDGVAVVSGDDSLSYAELERAANRLAHLLRRRGVGPDVRVGVCLERGPEMVVALLGVLKAGGAYAMLDPQLPPVRLALLLEDLAAPVVLSRTPLRERLPDEVDVLCLDAEGGRISREPDTAPAVEVTPEHLCYVIYTSGSMGLPKGTEVPHRAIPGFFHGADYARFDEAQVLLQHSSVSWDALTLELWPALLTGGRCVLYPGRSLDPEELAREVERHGVTTLWLTAALFNLIVDTRPELLDAVRQVMTGGEAVSVPHLRRARERNPGLRLVNGYGPSECTVFTSCHVVGDEVADGEVLPIGRPVGDRRVYVLDGWGEPVPVGVPGELHVGGPGVGRGYLGQAALTAEKFVPDALGGEPGARLYRTGDRVRWLATGELEFLGRVDAQVKIRGFRIELGEVEAVLASVPEVRESAVVAREDAPGDKRLVAYFVAREGAGVSAGELRRQLAARLPEYLVPAAFVALESLPLTPNGKLDRRALPAPAHGSAEDRYVAPRTPAEEVLAGIWAEVLGVERVGVEEGFFELGGHSLLATQVVSRARQALGVEVPLRALFEAPTVAALAGRVEALRSAGVAPAPPIGRVSREGPLPVSFAQQRLWVVDRLEPGSAAYNMPFALRLGGGLDTAALRASLDALVRRHETLRTTFAEQGGVPVQVVHPAAPVELRELDLRELPEAEREAGAEHLASEETLRPFDLARGPLLRSTLLRLGEEEHVLLFTLHHVVGDGWSMQVLVREVSALYAAFSRGEEPRLAELPVQYADFAVWQREWLSGEVLDEQVGYWKEALAGAPPLLEIATDRPRSAAQSTRAGVHRFALPSATAAGLRALSRREGTTLFMTLLAAWQTLLGRYAGQEDVVVGTPIAGRTRSELEGLIGFFVNMLALRGDLAGDPTWAELLGRVRETALGAFAHQHLPFERLVDELATERSLTHAPVFQAIFALDRAGARDERLSLGAVRLEPFGGEPEETKFDLNLKVLDDEEEISGALLYRAALFEAETAARMGGHLEVLLEAMAAAHPGQRLSEVPLLRGAEREQLLHAWNGPDTGYAGELCIHELVHAQVLRTPGAPALRFEGQRLGYAELYARASRLANRLRREGVGPETPVGICMEPAPEVVVSVLGVLLAGGAYLPLDPELPPERRAYVLGDAAPVLLLTQAALAERLREWGVPLLAVDAEAGSLARESGEAPQTGVGPDNLAYVIYTSGSTGRPKGVLVEHRGVGNTFLELGRVYGAGVGERNLAYAPLHFDASVADLFTALCSGAELVLARREAMLPGEDLLRTLREERITHLKIMPSALAVTPVEPLPDLRVIVTGGETLAAELVRRWGAGRKFFNGYGATEAGIRMTSSAYTADAGDPPIGRPVANTQLHVLDAQLEPVPPGVAGELYIGGVGMARGYLGRPDLTAERFLPDPHRGVVGARLYRTGDVGRRRADGEVEFLGRTDHQVKVRGYRVELGEIEAVLRMHGQVKEAVVLLREDVPGQPRLVAYVTGEAGAEPSAAGLRAHAAEQLPEYMVPGAFVVLERLPVTSNGKVDRRALPAPERASEGEYVEPRTAVEELLAGTWAELLHLERVGAADNFFGLGGHSLLATQVVSRARQAFGVEVPLRALFEAPTVAGLAARIEALRGDGTLPAPPMERVSREAPLPVSFAQQRLWVVDRLEPGSPAYNVPYALRLRGALEVGALRASLDALVRRHETLRTTFAEHDGGPVQVIHPPAPVALEELDLRGLPRAEREAGAERLASAEALLPFDLARGPLLRCTLLRLDDEDHVLCFTLHHIVSDGWSRGVLEREVSAFYAAALRGEAAELPELEVQYADFAVWQRRWLSGETLQERLGFWREALRGAPPVLAVPVDRPRAPGLSPRAGSLGFTLPARLSNELRALSRREGTTLFMTVLSGWQALLGRYAGQDDVVVGSPVAGRTRAETEGLIGFFVNMLALRADLGGDPTWAELLGRVREAALGAFEHQELPFERIVEELVTDRSTTHAPLFQVVFSLNRTGGREELSLGEVKLEPFGEGEGVARFDLNLAVMDQGEALTASLAYRESLFAAETAARMAEHLEALLEAMVAAPGRRLSEVSLLRGAEREQLLHAWNGPDTGYTGELCIHELVHAQVLRTPGAPALRFEGQRLGYAELYARASRLGNRLRREGVGPEVRVGICMEPAPEVVVSVLGVLLAGGAYLPLDPELPPERRAYVLGDAAPVLLLTQAALAGRLDDCGVPLLAVDAEAGTIARESAEAPQTGVGPDNLAYVIYTSGSTGRPKGVLVEHRGVGNTFLELGRVYGAGVGERNLAYAPLHFDASVADLFVALCSGAELVLARREAMLPGEDLLRLLREQRITHLKTMPSALAVTPVEALPELKTIVTGGETLPAEQVRRWGVGRRFFNGYGATEAGIRMTSSAYTADAGDPPIGRPVANTQLYVLDAQLEPVPPGVAGELYIGGVGMARGYLGRPDLTAERFLPDPHRGVVGARLYRTGDVGRRRADGEVEFLGRTDHQVKVRGYRVELGEIEAVLRGHGQVREAAVLLREDVPGQPRLVAYVAGEAGAELTAAELRGHLAGLRAHLAERLPEYMVPGAFVVLEQLPVTANGKIDRRALPAPERASGEEHVAPRTVVEELLAEIFAEVLRLERVGATDNFFELGGHSLLVTQVFSRLREMLGIEVPLRALFEQPTVEALARVVEDRLIGDLDDDPTEEHLEEVEPEEDPDGVKAAVR
ncbi:MAG: amino acid adenylation domain-containing protein [Gemmatimonadota bacterium]